VEEVLAGSFLDELPARLIADRAYDSDALDQRLKEEYDIELIAPHRGQRRVRTQHGRKLRRYSRRWRVERLFAWLHWFRPDRSLRLPHRELSRHVRLACIKLLLGYLLDVESAPLD
jgi:IS5 family transposase